MRQRPIPKYPDRCRYTWERRTPGRRYVNARGQCTDKATAECGRCAKHCDNHLRDGTICSHNARRRSPHWKTKV